jgi:hypothetical protein
VWTQAHDRFDGYTREAPAFKAGKRKPAVYPWPADGFRDRAEIVFWVSKISSVTLRVGGDRLRLGTLTGGWHSVSWGPGRRKPKELRPAVDATDLAGNKGSGPLAPIRIAVDTTPPDVTARVRGRVLRWRATDAETPWLSLRLRLVRRGKLTLVELGRRSLTGSARLSLPRGRFQAVLVAFDSSGNRTRVELGAI